jgi:RHS repeat-associated protein
VSAVRPSGRVRTVLLALLFAATTFAVEATPTEVGLPRPAALAPQPAKALACADHPSFEGRLTSSSSSTTAITRSTTGNVFGYISEVVDDWSCTAYLRYDGLAWSRDDGELDGNFDWGLLIDSVTVPCNWTIGETNYLKANSSADCADSDAEYAMPIYLANTSAGGLLEGTCSNDITPNEPCDFGFIHSDCLNSYLGGAGEIIQWNETFSTSNVGNRPHTNCDPLVHESTNTSQSIIVDGTAPAIGFDWPTAAGPTAISSAFASVRFDATDAIAGFDASHDWDLQRHKASWSGSACGSFSADGAATSGTTSAANQVSTQSLALDACYRWTLAATDANGNVASTLTSGIIRVDPGATLGLPAWAETETFDLGAGDSLAVNTGTGNLVVSHPLLSLLIRGSSVDLSLTYNRHDTADVGMGAGWRLDAFRRLTVNADNSVTFTAGDGARHTFTAPTGSPTVSYTRPPSLYATLTRDTVATPDRFTMTWRDQAKDVFDELVTGTGYLVREQDRHGNGVDLAYSSGQLTTITDTVPSPDRVIDLTWTSGKLTKIEDWAYVSGGVVQPDATGSRRAHRFFYVGGQLVGWADPANTSDSCSGASPSAISPSGASHVTCVNYPTDGLEITKTQTVTTIGGPPAALGTLVRTNGGAEAALRTTVAFSGADVTTIKDAQEVANASAGTAFSHPAGTTWTTQVVRRGSGSASLDTTTRYSVVGTGGDTLGRIAMVARALDGSWISRATAFDATYPVEPASVSDNDGALLSTPERTTSYTYQASSLGLVSKIVEPLTASDDRWTEFTYNANNDVTQQVVSLEGGTSDDTVSRSCYTSSGCSTSATDLVLRSTIDNYVDGSHGGTSGHVEDVTTEFEYDAYGQRTGEARHNYAEGSATPLDERVDVFEYDDRGNLTAEIGNHDDGAVTAGTGDTDPAPGIARTDLTTVHEYDTAGNRISTADPRRAIALAVGTEAYDPFERSVSDGWGTADTGGSWSGTDATFDVASGVGTITLGSNTNRNAYLTSTSLRDLELLVRVRVDQLAVGSDHFVWFYLRRQDANNHYQARLSFDTTGKTVLSLREVDGGVTTVLDAATTGLLHATADWYWLRVRLTGTSTLVAQARLWREGTTEPSDWTVEATDASPPAALQNAGDLGLRFQLGGSYSGGYPVIASFDDLVLTAPGGGGEAVEPDDYVTRTTYDALDRPVSETTPTTPGLASGAETASTTYDELGGVRSATDIAGLVTASAFDRAGRTTATFEDAPGEPAAQTSTLTVDPSGRVLTAKDRRQVDDANQGHTANRYDELGRLVEVTAAVDSTPDAESVTATTYDALDRVIATEVGDPADTSQLTELTLDLGGRAIETDDGFACTTTTYDHRDLPQIVTSALEPATCDPADDTSEVTNAYDALGRLVSATVTDGPDEDDAPTIATYDSVGNTLTSGTTVDAETTTTTFSRDALDQVTAELREDGSAAKTTYDPVGNSVDRCSWAADAVSVGDCLPVNSDQPTGAPTSSTSTRWDARNGRIGLTDAATNRTTVYDPEHAYRVSAVYLPTIADQTREHQSLYGYDERHRLTSITHQLCTVSSGHSCSATSAAGSVAYEYDEADNRTRVTEANGSASSDYRYCHDARGQLTGRGSTATCTTSHVESFAFDDAGNRTQAVEGGVTRNFEYTAAGLLCDVETGSAASCTGGNVVPDDAGRISDVAGWHFEYDAEGRLVSACEDADCVGSGFDRLDFVYDGEGHRTAILETPASGSPVETTFRYQGSAIVAEERDGDPYREYVVDDTGTISTVVIPAGVTGTGTYLVTWNGHGDALALWRIETDGSLTLANSYTYSTWGTPTTATHNSIPDLGFRFTYVGAHDVQWDDAFGLGLLYMHARHYSPSLGRFLQPDPSRLDEQLFVYAGNGPVSRVDPSGLWPWDDLAKRFPVNPRERTRCLANPLECYTWVAWSIFADSESNRRYPEFRNGSIGDAYKHCLWQCTLAHYLGPTRARIWGNIHEAVLPTGVEKMRKEMDLRNNRVARGLSHRIADGAGPNAVRDTSKRVCQSAIANGWLWHIRRGELIRTNARPSGR